MTNDKSRFKKVASLSRGSDRAVSPIIATLILIAIVVVMGGAVATMLLGFGSGTTQTPHPKITFNYQKGASDAATGSSGVVVVRDTGGAKLTNSNTFQLNITDTSTGNTTTWSTPVKAGDQLKVGNTGSPITINSGDHISVVWEGANGKNTETLASFDVPS